MRKRSTIKSCAAWKLSSTSSQPAMRLWKVNEPSRASSKYHINSEENIRLMATMAPLPKSQRFLATIYRIWMLRYVDVPEEVGRKLKADYARRGRGGTREKGKHGKSIPVVAMGNGRSPPSTLVPAGGGHYRLQFNVTLRKAAR